MVKVLCYKSEGRWLDRTMALRSTQPLNINEYQEHFLGVKVAGAYG